MAFTVLDVAIRPVGNKLMFTCEIDDDTSGTLDTGLTFVDFATATPRGATDNTFQISKSGGTLTFTGVSAVPYSVKAIGR